MNLNEPEMERLLRHAPRPTPPAGLKKQLMAQINLTGATKNSVRSVSTMNLSGWLRRWWPALVPAAMSLVCSVVLAVQRVEINELTQSIQTTRATANSVETLESAKPINRDQDILTPSVEIDEQAETARLTQRVQELTAEIAALERMNVENETLRSQLTTPAGLTAEEQADLEALAKAKERAMLILCINNLKQLGLAARLWAIDHEEVYPMDVLSMNDYIKAPQIFFCPADTNRQPATSSSAFTQANNFYDYLAPGGSALEPTRVLFRCPIHGNVGLCDGSVQAEVAKKHPERLIQRNGKVYFEPNSQPLPK